MPPPLPALLLPHAVASTRSGACTTTPTWSHGSSHPQAAPGTVHTPSCRGLCVRWCRYCGRPLRTNCPTMRSCVLRPPPTLPVAPSAPKSAFYTASRASIVPPDPCARDTEVVPLANLTSADGTAQMCRAEAHQHLDALLLTQHSSVLALFHGALGLVLGDICSAYH